MGSLSYLTLLSDTQVAAIKPSNQASRKCKKRNGLERLPQAVFNQSNQTERFYFSGAEVVGAVVVVGVDGCCGFAGLGGCF